MKEYYIKLDDNVYRLPQAIIYIDNYKEYLVNNIVIIDEIKDDIKLYKVLDKLFFNISRAICSIEDEYLNEDLYLKQKEIRKKINSLDSLSKFFYQKGKYKKCNELIKEFLIIMLKHHQNCIEQDEIELKEGERNVCR